MTLPETNNAERLQAIAARIEKGYLDPDEARWIVAQVTELRAECDALNESDLARSATIRSLRQQNTELRDALVAALSSFGSRVVHNPEPSHCATVSTRRLAEWASVLDKWKDAR